MPSWHDRHSRTENKEDNLILADDSRLMGVQVDRYEEYPKMRELIQRKDDLVAQRATPPYYLNVSYPCL